VAAPHADAPFDTFLSYHSGDSEWVRTLKSALESRGLRVWIDSEQVRPGDLFPGALARAIGSVRCVVIVLSPGSVASSWVEEEYNLALARRCHVVPILIDDAEPPGFLAGRTFVDFRDESRFETSLDHLVFGITGRSHGEGLPDDSPAYRDERRTQDAADETNVLKRLIERRRQDARRLWRARALSAIAGAGVGASFSVVAAGIDLEVRLAVCLLATLIVGLAGWAATATGLAHLTRKLEQFEVLHDGLDACRARSHPGCAKLRQHFWNMMVRNATDAGMDVRGAET
jgi:hypothetical protein